ncbi:MAG: DUF1801 domain-containing protein [Streptococcaceae bacterium]|jgi:uncharacterized protein YdhG (YjbR/CyaY superfamily)|nr:DUF1801 domain-containing protein [Streptococcaceae bacterium]
MEKAKSFDAYFSDKKVSSEKLARMQLVRGIVHDLYPDVQERVSYAMPGFYPKGATKATQMLFFVMANKNWLGLYGFDGLTPEDLPYPLAMGKGSVQVPYDFEEEKLRKLLQFCMAYNFERHGLELVH